ncbi:hypothetical protein GO594_31725, partial [Pseudomonas otitidis]|nr:hypothetical protein [Pseudomonas otitidis]
MGKKDRGVEPERWDEKKDFSKRIKKKKKVKKYNVKKTYIQKQLGRKRR